MFSNACTFCDRNFSPSGTKLLLSLLLLFVNFLHVMDAVSLFDDNDVALVLFSHYREDLNLILFYLLLHSVALCLSLYCPLFFIYIVLLRFLCLVCFLL